MPAVAGEVAGRRFLPQNRSLFVRGHGRDHEIAEKVLNFMAIATVAEIFQEQDRLRREPDRRRHGGGFTSGRKST